MRHEPKSSIKSSGVQLLDNILGGGIPAGSVVCCLINPKSMAEVLIYQLSSIGKVLYFTTERKPEHVLQGSRQLGFDSSNISFVDIYSKFNYEEKEQQSPTFKKNLYELSYISAKHDAKIFTESIKLPKDTLWKFEFWTKEKVIDILGDLSNKVFTKLLKTKEQSSFRFSQVDPKNKRFTVEFSGFHTRTLLDSIYIMSYLLIGLGLYVHLNYYRRTIKKIDLDKLNLTF
jgi:hypothetical protein